MSRDNLAFPVYRALTLPLLMAGVPREMAILNLTLTLALVFGMRRLLGVPLGILLHVVFVFFTKRDAQFFDVFRRSMKHKDHYGV